ncbi:MAG: Hsp20/alpha crystallin family protein [Elusimicrobiota bacterium]
MTTRGSELAAAETSAPRKMFVPAVDVYETKDEVTVLADMPGVDEKGVDIRLENDTLTIRGTLSSEGAGRGELVYSEYAAGDYRRTFQLSEQIDRDKIAASMKDGVLRLSLPKAEAARSRRIEVRAG